MSVYIPCLNVDKPDGGGGFSVGIGVGQGGGETGSLAPGVSFTHSDSPVTLTIAPVPPFIFFGPNWQFWWNLFGLGETRIEREKEQIQEIGTNIFQYLKKAYGVPIRDNHWLQFSSDGVKDQFRRRPDIAALVQYTSGTDDIVANLVFARKNASQGQEERVSNQFLANAAINNWPVNATIQIWDGIVLASSPECSTVPDRWKYNPEITQRTAELAVILQYIDLPVLANMATIHAIGNAISENLILQWAQNPNAVKDIPKRQQYGWQSLYSEGKWALPPYGNFLGGAQSLLVRDHIVELTSQVHVPRPQYPDFIVPQQQPPTPTPQPQPTPTPTPTPQLDLARAQAIVQRANQDILPTDAEDTWLRTDQGKQSIREYARVNPFPVNLYSYIIEPQGARPTAQEPTPIPGPQPPYVPPPQPQPEPPPQNTEEIPNQTDLARACQILRLLTNRQTLSDADYDWMLTNIGAKALAQQSHNPLCTQPEIEPGPNPPPQNTPDCPTPQLPYPDGPYYPQPGPLPFPNQPTPQEPQGCDPECLQLIEMLRQQQQSCCDEVHLVVYPRLLNLETWIIDIERRLPGPMPPVPYPPFVPPSQPYPDPTPVPPGPEPPPPGEPLPPQLPPEVVACVETLCDQEKFCQMVQACERELECLTIGLCDPLGGPWGGMAECWQNANKTPDRGVQGAYAGVAYPDSAARLYTLSYEQSVGIQGKSQGGTYPQSFVPSDPLRWNAPAQRIAAGRVQAWKSKSAVNTRESPTIPSRPWIFANPADGEPGQIKVRSVKPRDGEIDPCSGVTQGTLELP